MQEQTVEFFSDGSRMSGILRTPDDMIARCPAIVQGPGWLGLKDAKLYLPYHEALTAAGYQVLIFDYRGFGDSEGDRGLLLPHLQLEDMINAVTYLTTRDDVDADNIGVFGSGGTGGGNAVLLAATDRRGPGEGSQVPVSRGGDRPHRLRRGCSGAGIPGRTGAEATRRGGSCRCSSRASPTPSVLSFAAGRPWSFSTPRPPGWGGVRKLGARLLTTLWNVSPSGFGSWWRRADVRALPGTRVLRRGSSFWPR